MDLMPFATRVKTKTNLGWLVGSMVGFWKEDVGGGWQERHSITCGNSEMLCSLPQSLLRLSWRLFTDPPFLYRPHRQGSISPCKGNSLFFSLSLSNNYDVKKIPIFMASTAKKCIDLKTPIKWQNQQSKTRSEGEMSWIRMLQYTSTAHQYMGVVLAINSLKREKR
jgi:hypothetical protein